MTPMLPTPQPILAPRKLLVIRRDNIGDLVCTTPLLRSLRQKYPQARIDALVTSYNEPILENNPDVDYVYAYTKAKHRGEGQSVLGVYWQRFKLIRQLRRQGYDCVVIASTGFLKRPVALARWIGAKHIVGFADPQQRASRAIDIPIPIGKPHPMHLVEEMAALLKPFGIEGVMPAMRVIPDPKVASRLRNDLEHRLGGPIAGAIGIHISARKPKQRWPEAHFIDLIQRLHAAGAGPMLLFWSPGAEDNPQHPGDDNKAARILAAVAGLPIVGVATHGLDELIAGLSLTTTVICSDGGAMHVAAALGKPLVCFFGNSDASVWYPWGTPHELLQKSSQDVADISVDEVVAAHGRLPPALPTEHP